MTVKVDKEYLARKSRASKSSATLKSSLARGNSFSHKVKNGGAGYSKSVRENVNRKGASKEVLVKISGGARAAQGIKNTIDYISRESELPIITDENIKVEGKDVAFAKDYMVDANDPRQATDENGEAKGKITQNFVFSAPSTAKVSSEDMLNSVHKVMKEKYPNNRFVMAYHEDTKDHPHVHVVMRTKCNEGFNTYIKKADLRDIRSGLASDLQSKGYDVKATHKQHVGLNKRIQDEHNRSPNRMKGVYEVVDFGRDHFNHDKRNKMQNFLKVKTLNKGVEKTYWGTDFEKHISENNIRIGDLVKVKKLAQVEVNVPKNQKDGVVTEWMKTHKNAWEVTNLGARVEKQKQELTPVFKTRPEQGIKQAQGYEKFMTKRSEVLKNDDKLKSRIKIGF